MTTLNPVSSNTPASPSASADPTRKKKNQLFVSLRIKLLLTFSTLFIVAFAASYYWFYSYVTNLAMTRITTDLTNIVKAAADGVDAEQLMTLYAEGVPNTAGFTDDPRFTKQINWLDSVHHIDPRAWPYIYVPTDKPQDVIFLVDLWARYEPTKASKFKERYTSTGKMTNGFKEFFLYAEKPYKDNWGTWVSAYAPVRNKEGKIVAAVGVDYQASYIEQVQNDIQTNVGIGAVVLFILLLVMVYLISRALTQPIGRLTSAARQVGEGKYDQNITTLSATNLRDEIVLLAEVFTSMAAKIYQRDQALIRKVEELKIEFVETTRQKQVEEIVDSEFFQDLKAKAKAMRRRP